ASERSAVQGVRPRHQRGGHFRARPPDPRALGGGRTPDRGPPLLLVSARRLTGADPRAERTAMASSFNVELSMQEPPAEAQARAAAVLADPARAVGLRLTKRSSGELRYGPRVQFPFLL